MTLQQIRELPIVEKCRQSRKFLIFIVYIALFLDNMLLTTVVPIIPEYLYKLNHPNRNITAIYSTAALKPHEPVLGGEGMGSWNAEAVAQLQQRARAVELRREVRRDLADENVDVGIMFGSKALVQIIINSIVGPITTKIGYTVPMFAGFVVLFVSTIIFAFGQSYAMLFLARTFQGVGSAFTSTSGMGMIAERYPDDQERGAAMGVALGGLALGVLVGPPYGGMLYQWANKALPFILLSLLALFDGSLQFIVLKPQIVQGPDKPTSTTELLKDPYILIAVGAITIGNLGIAFLEPTLPLWMMTTMQAKSATRGAAFLPASVSYLVGTSIFGPLSHKLGRWLSSLIGLVIISGSLLVIPSATCVTDLIIPNGLLGLAIGMIDASMFPQMGYLVDLRHDGVYGSIYAIADTAFCLAFAMGPIFGAPIVEKIGFPCTIYIIALITLLYAPLMILLRNPERVEKEKQQLMHTDEYPVGYTKLDEKEPDEVTAHEEY